MLRVLDPHSSFLTRARTPISAKISAGGIYGVGMTIVPRENYTYVLAPMPGSPAYGGARHPPPAT